MKKCLVCGQLVEEGVLLCPVCGAGVEALVPVEAAGGPFLHSTDEVVLILGTGAAALSAATALRARNRTCAILMIGEEPLLPYHRPMLTKHLFDREMDSFLVHDEAWYQAQDIQVLRGMRIASLHPLEREVVLEDGTRFRYHRCIYALGAHSFVPPMDGVNLPQVMTLRSAQDVTTLRTLIPPSREVAIVGGGVLGLEAAWALKEQGSCPTVVESADRLLAGKITPSASAFLQQRFEAAGVTLITNARTARIEGEDAPTALLLEDGRRLPCSFVLLSTGVRANVELAKQAGVACDRSVIVDDHMRTNFEGLFACGDCAQYEGVNFGLWSQATEMGKVAGANAAGDMSVVYHTPSPALTLDAFHTSLYSLGEQGEGTTLFERRDDDAHTLAQYFFKEERLVGACLIGLPKQMAAVTKAIASGESFTLPA